MAFSPCPGNASISVIDVSRRDLQPRGFPVVDPRGDTSTVFSALSGTPLRYCSSFKLPFRLAAARALPYVSEGAAAHHPFADAITPLIRLLVAGHWERWHRRGSDVAEFVAKLSPGERASSPIRIYCPSLFRPGSASPPRSPSLTRSERRPRSRSATLPSD